MPLGFAHRIFRYSEVLISPVLRDFTRLSTSQPPGEVQCANRGSLRTLFLLSTFVSASRCHWTNEAALRRPMAFLRSSLLFFEGRFTRPTFILERQRRAPTKGRIQNTPKNRDKGQGKRSKCQGGRPLEMTLCRIGSAYQSKNVREQHAPLCAEYKGGDGAFV